jgi:7-cyano-7-deazaguanine synthase
MDKGIVIVSGGMDSVTLMHLLHNQGNEIHAISFDYGQRHAKELIFARKQADSLEIKHTIVPMGYLSSMLHGSALTSQDVEVPEGHYADDNMRLTVVPNRNSIMLNIATGIAIAEGAAYVATAVHAGDHAVYPDCRPEFIESLTDTLKIANEGFIDPGFTIFAPFVHIGKHDICVIGDEEGVDWVNTWSCYKGLNEHCGKCGTCVERKEAFRLSNVIDPTEYDDNEFGVEAFRG